MSAPRSVELDEVVSLGNMVLERLVAQDVQTVLDLSFLGFGNGLLEKI